MTDASKFGLDKTVDNYLMWAKMRMSPTDFADVTGIAYTYMVNGLTPDRNWTGIFKPGERVRLRVINASTMTIHDLQIPGLKMTVVAVDGQYVAPVEVEEFRIAPAETYDIIVQPTEDKAYPIFAQSLDRSGYAGATLAPREGMRAEMPALEPRPLRTMADMGMDMNMGGGGMKGMNMGDGMKMGDDMKDGAEMAPSAFVAGKQAQKREEIAESLRAVGAMPGMTMSGVQPASGRVSANASKEMNMKAMPTPGQHQMAGLSMAGGGHPANLASIPGAMPVPSAGEDFGPGNATLPMTTRSRLNEPGTGLENNGRRVLVYTDLRALKPYPDQREPSREVVLHITGNMDRQIWGFNGKKYSDAPPVVFNYGERVRLTLVNDTMMEHPIHLHGMWFHIQNGHGPLAPRKHTMLVKPAERVSLDITADAPGQWAMHCHLLFHMELGMFRVVKVLGAPSGALPGELSESQYRVAPGSSAPATPLPSTDEGVLPAMNMDMGDMKGMKMGGGK